MLINNSRKSSFTRRYQLLSQERLSLRKSKGKTSILICRRMTLCDHLHKFTLHPRRRRHGRSRVLHEATPERGFFIPAIRLRPRHSSPLEWHDSIHEKTERSMFPSLLLSFPPPILSFRSHVTLSVGFLTCFPLLELPSAIGPDHLP